MKEPLLPHSNPTSPKTVSCSLLQRQWTIRVAVLSCLLVVASLLTWKLPGSKLAPGSSNTWASLVGWLYFLMWTISFYPQLLRNYTNKSVEGLCLDFVLMNIAGFACYMVFNLALFSSATVQAEYKQRFHTISIPVELNDVVFGIHALLLSISLAVQYVIYPRSSTQRASVATCVGLLITVLVGMVYAGVIAVHGEHEAPWTWLSWCYYCSYVKMAITLIKYIPQVHLNYKRQSTSGWSIDNVLLDMGGGLLSTAQLLINCHVLGDWTAVTGNPIKFGLGLTSMVFDLVFLLQHYVWFREETAPDEHAEAAAAAAQSYRKLQGFDTPVVGHMGTAAWFQHKGLMDGHFKQDSEGRMVLAAHYYRGHYYDAA